MKKIFTKFTALTLIFTTILGGGMKAYAEESTKKTSLELEGYTVTTLTDEEVPENINLENLPSFSSIEEAESYIKELNNNFDEMTSQPFSLSASKKSRDTISPLSTSIKSIVKYAGSPNLNINELYVEIGFTYTSSPNRFKSLTYVSSYMTGSVFGGAGWTQTSQAPIYKILDGGRTASVTVNGTLDAYIVIKSSVTKISSTPQTINLEFYYTDF